MQVYDHANDARACLLSATNPPWFDPRMPTRSDAISEAARRPALAKHALPWYHVSLTDRVAAGRLDPPSSIRSPGAYASQAAEIMRQHLETMHTMAMRLIRTHIVPVRGERF